MLRCLVLLSVLFVGGCGARTVDGTFDDGDATSPSPGPTAVPTSSNSLPPPSPKRSLDEFRKGVVGVWEGTITSEYYGSSYLSFPAKKLRIELTADGRYIGTCLEPSDPVGDCRALHQIADGPSPYRTWRIERLTAGFEGMGEIADRTDPSYVGRALLHRVRLSGDGQRLEFAVPYNPVEDDAILFNYWLTRVSR